MHSPSHPASSSNGRRPRGALNRLLDQIGSVWLGITLASLLFLYCSIGSALPQVRQLPWLEMTEFEWFHWWPFNALIAVFCISLLTATIRRIPLRTVNFGVWTIHSGLIVLVLGSYYYFATKVEGDTAVLRRQVRIEAPGADQPLILPALPGNRGRLPTPQGTWEFQVQSTNSDWPILSEEDKGKTAYAVNVNVQPPDGEPFVRQVLAGYPQYDEDVLPGKGRAIKNLGRKLVAEDLRVSLDFLPQEWFHVKDTWALFVRRTGEKEWTQRRIAGLPRYHDRIADRSWVFSDPREDLPSRPIDLRVPPATEGSDPLTDARLHVTGYLRYAQMRTEWGEGGERLHPVLRLSLLADHAPGQTYELVAFDRQRRVSEDGLVQFVWAESAAEASALSGESRPMLRVEVPAASVSLDVALTADSVNPDGAFVPIEGTDFAYRVRGVQDNLALPNQNRSISVAIVEVKTPEGTFRRWVSDVPEFTRDIHGEGMDPHDVEARGVDERIVMSYQPASAPVLLAAHPGGLHFVFSGREGQRIQRPINVGERVEIIPGLFARVDGYWARAVAQRKPFIVPRHARQRDAGESFSMIRLEVDTGRETQTQWIHFHPYALPGPEYSYGGRFPFAPSTFRAADGSMIEVMFSRERRRLPNPVALEAFTLDTHVGGYTGQALTIRNYVSELRFLEGSDWTEPTSIAVNAPTENAGFWYFQSTWDKPANDHPTGGMNYTGLGVGNRNGVYAQLIGCCLMVAGMIFAFYVKPVLIRKRYERSRARIDRTAEATAPLRSADAKAEEVAV